MNRIEPKKFNTMPALQSGFTLIEMMVAMTIGLIILAALGQLFVSSRSSYNMGEGVARTQESGRFGMEFLTLDIRQAGYAGCHNPSDGAGAVNGNGAGTTCTTSFCNLVNPADDSSRFAAEGVRGYVYAGGGTNNLADWEPDLPDVFFDNGEVKASTDVIIIQYASSMGVTLTGNVVPDNGNIQLGATPWADGNPANGELAADDILVVSDCKNTDVFRATNVSGGGTIAHGATGNASSHLTHSYGADAELLRLESRAYFIQDNVTSGEPALMRKALGSAGAMGAAQELVQSIEDMRIRYGVDTDLLAAADGIANRYVLADDVVDLTGPGTTNWDNVVSIRLGLLIRTPASVDMDPDTGTYELVDGVVVDPVDDNRRRQIYRTTIKLRNSCKNGVPCY